MAFWGMLRSLRLRYFTPQPKNFSPQFIGNPEGQNRSFLWACRQAAGLRFSTSVPGCLNYWGSSGQAGKIKLTDEMDCAI
jgi:hypothetical protein